MNSNTIINYTFRWILILTVQVLLLKRIDMMGGWFYYMSILLYPILIIILPLRLSTITVMAIGFLTGLYIDMFYDSLGVHASACVFLGFTRGIVLAIISPREGYNVSYSPTIHQFGLLWFVRYTSILMGLFLFFYFSMEAFTFYYIFDIIGKTIISFIVSMIFIIIYMFIFNPKE